MKYFNNVYVMRCRHKKIGVLPPTYKRIGESERHLLSEFLIRPLVENQTKRESDTMYYCKFYQIEKLAQFVKIYDLNWKDEEKFSSWASHSKLITKRKII
jgi:hypothetical protein